MTSLQSARRAFMPEVGMPALRWPRSDVIAVVGVIVAAVGAVAAVVAIPELHDMVFGSTSQDHAVASKPPAATSPQPSEPDSKKESLRMRAGTLLSSANSLVVTGQNDQARADFNDARSLYHELGDKLGEANALRGLGDVERLLGRNDQARPNYNDARSLFSRPATSTARPMRYAASVMWSACWAATIRPAPTTTTPAR